MPLEIDNMSSVELSMLAEENDELDLPLADKIFMLKSLLSHPSAVVREGAMYGVCGFKTPEFKVIIEDLLENDPHPGVRQIAQAILTDWNV